MTFKTSFNHIFDEKLKEIGYHYNSKYGMHMRFINDELLEYITYITYQSTLKGYKNYTIYVGVVSIYNVDLTKADLIQNANVLDTIAYEYYNSTKEINGFYYNDQTMLETIELSFDKTKEFILPVFDQINDLNSYIAYKKKVGIFSISGAADYDKHQNDALVLIKAKNHDDFQDVYQRELDRVKVMFAAGEIGGTLKEQQDLLYDSIINNVVNSRDQVYADQQLYAKVIEQLNKRKETNLRILKDYGVIINL